MDPSSGQVKATIVVQSTLKRQKRCIHTNDCLGTLSLVGPSNTPATITQSNNTLAFYPIDISQGYFDLPVSDHCFTALDANPDQHTDDSPLCRPTTPVEAVINSAPFHDPTLRETCDPVSVGNLEFVAQPIPFDDDGSAMSACSDPPPQDFSAWLDQDPSMASPFLLDNDAVKQSGSNLHHSNTPPLAQACLGIVQCFQTFPRQKPHPVAICETLPHIMFPIGRSSPDRSWKHQHHLRAVFDSGAGVSLGYLPYFQDLYNKYPELVLHFGAIDSAMYTAISVGNIDKFCDATTCTHYIELYTPFYHNGQQVSWRLALSNVLAVNALMGLPFMMQAKMVPHFCDCYVHSSLFQTNFDLKFMAPLLQESVPQQDGQVAAFSATPDPNPASVITVLDPTNPKASSQ